MAMAWPATTALRLLVTGGDALHHGPAAHLPFEVVNQLWAHGMHRGFHMGGAQTRGGRSATDRFPDRRRQPFIFAE